MNFYELLILAKSGDDLANEKILAMYQPLLQCRQMRIAIRYVPL